MKGRGYSVGNTIWILVPVILLFCTGCTIHSGGVLEIEESGPSLVEDDWSNKRVWFRTFEHTDVAGVSTVYASGPGGTASAIGVTRGKYREPPQFLVRAIEDTGIFKSVTPTIYTGTEPDLILEGSVTVDCETPGWTWIQLVDLWIHAWFFPTLGRNWTTEGEFSLYDRDHVLLHRWKFRCEDSYMATVWWMIGHGGADDTGFDVERQNETAKRAVEEIFLNMPCAK